MEKNKSKNGWGGKREGSGRPRTTTIQRVYSIRTNDELAEYIESHENKSEFIKGCVIKEMKGLYGVPAEGDVAMTDAIGAEAAESDEGVMCETLLDDTAITDDAKAETQSESVEVAPATTSFEGFDYSTLGEVCMAENVKSVNIPFVDTKTDASSFHMENRVEGHAQEVDLLNLLSPKLHSSSLIRVKGDSMTDADIYDGDIIIVDMSNRNPTDRELAVCELNGEYTIKYVRVRDKRGILVPANRDYPEWRITPDDNFNVWGTVTFVIHKPRNL